MRSAAPSSGRMRCLSESARHPGIGTLPATESSPVGEQQPLGVGQRFTHRCEIVPLFERGVVRTATARQRPRLASGRHSCRRADDRVVGGPRPPRLVGASASATGVPPSIRTFLSCHPQRRRPTVRQATRRACCRPLCPLLEWRSIGRATAHTVACPLLCEPPDQPRSVCGVRAPSRSSNAIGALGGSSMSSRIGGRLRPVTVRRCGDSRRR